MELVPPFYESYPIERMFDIVGLISLLHRKRSLDYVFPGERHAFWEFVYIEKGAMIITAGTQEYLLKAGEIAFHLPGEFHALRTAGEQQAETIVAGFDCHSPYMNHFKHRITKLTISEREFLYDALQQKERAFGSESLSEMVDFSDPKISPVNIALIQSNLELLLASLIQQKKYYSILVRKESNSTLPQAAMEYMRSNLSKNLQIAKVADHLGYSVSHLKKLFSEEMGQGIIDWLIDQKINKAKEMILSTDLKISEIAYKMGYESIPHFTRTFKQRVGMSPSEFRNRA